MSKLEDGYFYGDSNGNVRFVSYDTLGSGGAFFILVILATVFLEKVGNFFMENQWIVLIPAIIAVVYRCLVYDRGLSAKHKICNIAADAVRTLGIYGILISLFSEVLSRHILDRLFVALGLGLVFGAAYWLVSWLCKFFRSRRWLVAHFITSIVTALVSLKIYLDQVNSGKIKLPTASATKPTIKDDYLESLMDSVGKATFSLDNYPMLSFLIFLVSLVFGIAVVSIPIFAGIMIGKKINRETQAKFDAIGSELKKFLPNDADVYCVRYDGISYADQQDNTYFLSFEELGYAPFPNEKQWEKMLYMNNMAKWLLKNIVTDAKRYRLEVHREDIGYVCLRSNEYIRRHTLKQW